MDSSRVGRRMMKKAALREAFHAAGMRLTRQRLAIYRELTGRYDHPDVDSLFRSVKPKVPQLSLFTVYRTMNALEGAGMVRRVATWKGHARYDGDVQTHAHFLCESCGKITDIDVGDMSELCSRVAGSEGEIRRVDLMFYGEGPVCGAKHAR
jgi:Fur family transcriptional regulator, peroxide stress response regulator